MNSVHLPTGVPGATIIGIPVGDSGNNTVIGAGSILRSSIIDDDCVVGENCYLMDGARMERGSALADNTVVPKGVLIPAGQLWAGNPATFQGEHKHAASHLT